MGGWIAIYTILGFLAVMAILNVIDSGQID
jgi:hypothetical protein